LYSREVVTVSTENVPAPGPAPISTKSRAQTLRGNAYKVNLAYLLWFWITFAAGYWVYSWFDLDPSVDRLADHGLGGRVALTAWALFASVPSWFGARFALRSMREGGGRSAGVALAVNLVLVAGFLVWILLSG
jgi:hypothetical protein